MEKKINGYDLDSFNLVSINSPFKNEEVKNLEFEL